MKMIECKCGCGNLLEEKDKYGRKRSYVSGHNNKKYDDPTQYKREWNHRNREARYKYKVRLISNFKLELVNEKGGECKECGLEFNISNLCIVDFHHRDPKDKKFGVNKANMNKISKQSMRKEADKCDIYCANCHRLKHWGENVKI